MVQDLGQHHPRNQSDHKQGVWSSLAPAALEQIALALPADLIGRTPPMVRGDSLQQRYVEHEEQWASDTKVGPIHSTWFRPVGCTRLTLAGAAAPQVGLPQEISLQLLNAAMTELAEQHVTNRVLQAQVDQLQVAHDAVHLENVALEDNDELTVSSACRVELQRALPDAMCSWPRSRSSSS